MHMINGYRIYIYIYIYIWVQPTVFCIGIDIWMSVHQVFCKYLVNGCRSMLFGDNKRKNKQRLRVLIGKQVNAAVCSLGASKSFTSNKATLIAVQRSFC